MASLVRPFGWSGSAITFITRITQTRSPYLVAERTAGPYTAFWQVSGQHQAHSCSATGNVQAYDQPGFTTYDAAVGISGDRWTLQLVGQTLTDQRADLFENSNEFISWKRSTGFGSPA